MSWSEFGQQLPFPGHRKSADTGFLIGDYRPQMVIPDKKKATRRPPYEEW